MKHWYKIILVGLFLVENFSVLAQDITFRGIILSKENKEPLAGATVQIKKLQKAVTTDIKGKFEFTQLPTGNYIVEVSYIGKITLATAVNFEKTLVEQDFILESEAYNMAEITVREKSERLGLQRLNAVEGVAIYAGKKSEVVTLDGLAANLATNNPRQVFARVAGLNIWESDGAGLQLGIGGRGLSPNRTSNFNTRQNGYDISADALGYPETYYTPPTEALKRIEVVRGAASLQYGTQFGGMLNFVLRNPPENKKIEVRTRQTVGSYGFINTFNALAGTVGAWSYTAFYQYKKGDGWRANSAFDLENAMVRLGFAPSEKLRLWAEWTRTDYLAQQPGGLTDAYFEQNPRTSYRSRNWFDVNWNLFAFNIDYQLSPATKLNIRNFGLLARRDALGNLAPINIVDLGGNRDLITGAFRNIGNETRLLRRYNLGGLEQIVVVGFRLYNGQTTTQQGDANDGTGADFYFLNPSDVEKSDYTFGNRNAAVFAEHIFYLTPQLTLTPGIRLEHIRTAAAGYYKQRVFDAAGNLVSENRQTETTNRRRSFLLAGIGLGYQPSQAIEWYANLSQNYRAINFSDLRVENPNAKVDANIKDESGFTADIGFRAKKSWFSAEVTAFYIAYRDRIGWVLKANEPPLYNDFRFRTNVADARNIGLEALIELDLRRIARAPADSLRQWSVFLNAAAIDARYIRTENTAIAQKKVELVPPLTLRIGTNYTYRHFHAAASWAFTAQHFTDATNAQRTASAVNGIIPAYQVADLSLRYVWRVLTLEASCNNLFNTAYFTRRADSYPGPGIIPADGRTFFTTLELKF